MHKVDGLGERGVPDAVGKRAATSRSVLHVAPPYCGVFRVFILAILMQCSLHLGNDT